MINKLLEVRGKKPGKAVSLTEDDLKHLCTKSREIFITQPNLLELEAPIKICGKFFFARNSNTLTHFLCLDRRCSRPVLRFVKNI